MKTFKYISLFLAVLYVGGCKKKDLPTNTNEVPIFEVQAKIGNDSINYAAGDNNFILNTDYYIDSSNMRVLMGNFININDNTGLKIELVSPATSTYVTTLNHQTFKGYSNPAVSGFSSIYTYSFFYKNALNNVAPISVLWNFGDGNTSTLLNPTHVYSTSGTKTVTLISNFLGGCSDTVSNTIEVNVPDPCQVQFDYTYDSVSNIIACVADSGFTSYNWDFGDTIIFQAGKTYTHQYSTHDKYNVVVTAISSSCTAQFTHHVATTSSVCGSGFTYTIDVATIGGPINNDYSAIVTYKSPTGTTYSNYRPSYLQDQAGTVDLRINNYSSYKQNDKGQSTSKIENASLKGWLYNRSNYSDSVYIETSKLKFAVAHE